MSDLETFYILNNYSFGHRSKKHKSNKKLSKKQKEHNEVWKIIIILCIGAIIFMTVSNNILNSN